MYDSATLPDRIPFGPAPPPGAEPETKAQAKPYDENEDLPCLLWDTVPDNPDNADLAAMQSLMYDECTAAERAENFKVHPCHRDGGPFRSEPASCLSMRARNVPPLTAATLRLRPRGERAALLRHTAATPSAEAVGRVLTP